MLLLTPIFVPLVAAIGMGTVQLGIMMIQLSFSFVPALTLRIPERAVHPVGLQRQVAGPVALISQHSKRRTLGNPEPGAQPLKTRI